MGKNSKAYLATFIVLVFFLGCSLPPAFASQGSAESAISSAKDTIKQCYDAVKQAEGAGANVAALMVTLNEAAGLLSQAELEYASSDYNSAFNHASQSQRKLDGFINQAVALRATAQQIGSQNFVSAILSLLVSLAILCAGIVCWVALSRRERRSSHGSPKL